MGSDNFCLRWNDFEHNINSSLKELRDEKDFFDVTLACEGDDQIQAHKLILSACSPFFKHLLRRHSHQHPLLYLRGIKHKELQNIINFMYYGEVNVAQADLNSFLSVSEELQVKGLTQDYKTDARNKAQHKNKSSRLNPDFDNDINDTTSETLCVKMEPPVLDSGSKTKHPPSVPFQHNEISGVFDDNYDDYTNYEDYSMDTVATGQENNKERYAELQDFIKRNVGPGHTCLICGKECKFVHAVQYHIESAHGKHFNVTYQCEICNKTVDTKNAFITHKSRHHKKGSLGPFLNMC